MGDGEGEGVLGLLAGEGGLLAGGGGLLAGGGGLYVLEECLLVMRERCLLGVPPAHSWLRISLSQNGRSTGRFI